METENPLYFIAPVFNLNSDFKWSWKKINNTIFDRNKISCAGWQWVVYTLARNIKQVINLNPVHH